MYKILLLLFLCSTSFANTLRTHIQKLTKEHQVPELMKVILKDKKKALKEINNYITKGSVKDLSKNEKYLILNEILLYLNIVKTCDNKFILSFSDKDYRNKLIYNIAIEDRADKVSKILETLYNHDPKELKKYWNLALALAFVWDSDRPLMHRQMGTRLLKDNTTITQRYDYFKNLYKRGAKFRYDYLSLQELIFVVNTPVPISELNWARKKINSSATNWGKNYSAIKYNWYRANNGKYNWYQGIYSLESIKRLGGICTDQTYYTVIGARAWGIPAMYFIGRSGTIGHAWAGVMTQKGKWNLNIGRYSQYKVVSGYAMNPQTNILLNDAQLDYICNSKLKGKYHELSKRYEFLANFFLKKKKLATAKVIASQALKSNQFNYNVWSIIEKCNNEKENIKLLNNKINTFKKYPDLINNITLDLVTLFIKLKKLNDAISIYKKSLYKVSKNLSLASQLTHRFVKILYENDYDKEGLKHFEQFLKTYQKKYANINESLVLYLYLTKKYNQTKQAPIFLKSLYQRESNKEKKNLIKNALTQANYNNNQSNSSNRRR